MNSVHNKENQGRTNQNEGMMLLGGGGATATPSSAWFWDHKWGNAANDWNSFSESFQMNEKDAWLYEE